MRYLIGTVLLALVLSAVWVKVDIYRTGYTITDLQTQKKQAQQEQKALLLEFARLTSPEQVERVAVSQLGMVRPRYNQVVLVKGAAPPPSETPASRVVRASHTN
jgi:cell division protein FtsL